MASQQTIQKTIKAFNLHRTINGSSKEAQNYIIALLKLMNVEFVRKGDRTFIKMHDGVVELLKNGLVDLESLIRQKAIDIANANTPDFVSKKLITDLAKERVGPAGTVKEMLDFNSTNLVQRVSNEMRRLNAEGYSSDEIRRAIIGNPSLGYQNGVLGKSIKGSEVMMRTAAVMTDEAAQDAARRQDTKVIGYVWQSVLDSGTTITCADLNGREFYYADSGAQPLPPQHVGCRSTTLPIEKNQEVPHVMSFNEFLKESPDEARDMLGATRYQLVTEGKLRIDRLTDRHFNPMTIDELKQKNAVAFRRIE